MSQIFMCTVDSEQIIATYMDEVIMTTLKIYNHHV